MAVVDMDTVLVATPWTGYTIGSTNIPEFWIGVIGGELPADPLVPKEGEIVTQIIAEGAYEVAIMGDTAIVQRVQGYDKYGNRTLSMYERYIFPGEDPATGLTEWSRWQKIS